jgi:metallophosphoesterase (TIGR00282 family)
MRILFLGDVFGRSGRDAIAKYLPTLKQKYEPDFTIVNGENAAHGFGIMPDMAKDFFHLGIDVITGGNHSFDKNEIITLMSQSDKVLRPLNYPKNVPGKGFGLYPHNGKNLLVINAMGRLFMESFLDCPFQAVEEVLKRYPLGGSIAAIFVDMHGEATSEKIAMAKYFDGKVTAVIGTHTHIPTADAHIMKGGTAYLSDAGMCGDYDSIIGVKTETALAGFFKKTPKPKKEPANGEGTVCGVFIETGPNGHAIAIEPIRIGPILMNTFMHVSLLS